MPEHIFSTPVGTLRGQRLASGWRQLRFDDSDVAVAAEADVALTRALAGYWGGALGALEPVELDLIGTPFQVAVWEALRTVPPGNTTTYAALAANLGRGPGASRAVGAAVGANPLALLIPCHRVLGSDGGLTGYAWGLERKRQLLLHEGWRDPSDQQRSLFPTR